MEPKFQKWKQTNFGLKYRNYPFYHSIYYYYYIYGRRPKMMSFEYPSVHANANRQAQFYIWMNTRIDTHWREMRIDWISWTELKTILTSCMVLSGFFDDIFRNRSCAWQNFAVFLSNFFLCSRTPPMRSLRNVSSGTTICSCAWAIWWNEGGDGILWFQQGRNKKMWFKYSDCRKFQITYHIVPFIFNIGN